MAVTGRASDERILTWIKDRCAGKLSAYQIAARDGVVQSQVIKSTNDVLAADKAESGEVVSGAYWT